MSKYVAAALVFVCSAAVLMLEILAGRLLAPYVGISLETYTSIIGTVLAGIAVGAWLGGKLADRIDPRRLLGPTVCFGGLLALFTVPIVRALGDQSGDGGRGATLFLTFTAFFLPAVVLSAVTPMVVKLQLHDLAPHGRCRRAPEWHLDVRRAGRHLRDRVPAHRHHADPHGHLRTWGGADRGRSRARIVALAPRRRGAGRPRRPGCGCGDDRRERRRTVPDRECVLLHPRRARSRALERAHPVARQPHAQLRRPERPDLSRIRLHQVLQSTRSRRRGPTTRRSTRCTSVAVASRCRGISAPSTRARRARCSRSIPSVLKIGRDDSASGRPTRLQVRIGDARIGIRARARRLGRPRRR